MEFNVVETTININREPYKILLLIKNNFGEKIGIIKIYIMLNIKAAKLINIIEVLIFSFFLLDVERYLTIAVLNPNKLNEEISVMTEIKVVAKPICSVVNNLAQIIQKKNPNPAITAVLAIK